MADSTEAWEEAAEQFRALGRQLRSSSRQDREAGGADAEERAAVEEALRTIADAVERGVEAVGSAARTPEFRDQAKHAARSLGDAIGATFAELGAELRQRSAGRDDSSDDDGAQRQRDDG